MAKKKQFDYYHALYQLAEKAHLAVQKLDSFVQNDSNEKCSTVVEAIQTIEHEADEIVREVMEQLQISFITPIDHEDIYTLCEGIDDIVDNTLGTVYLLENLQVDHLDPLVSEFTPLLVRACAGLEKCTNEFRHFKQSKMLYEMIRKVKEVESEADKLYSRSIKEIFQQKDALTVLKTKTIYDKLEECSNQAEVAADIMLKMMIKNR